LVPDVGAEHVAEVLNNGLEWIGHHTLPGFVVKFFKLETKPGPAEVAAAVRSNADLYRFSRELRGRVGYLRRIVTRGLFEKAPPPWLFAGCYLAGTGRGGEQQAFVAGIFDRFLKEQDWVSWTPEAQNEEAWYRRSTQLGWLVVAILVLLAVLCFAGIFHANSRESDAPRGKAVASKTWNTTA
jgi:hypothetical protein